MQVNDNLDRIGKAAQAAWSRVKKAQSRMWGEWMTIGEGLLEGRNWAMQVSGVNRPEGRGYVTAYAEYLKRYRLDDMDKSDRAKLLQLMEERAAVEEWRSTLPDYERRSLNNPVIVWRKWTTATRVRKLKPRTVSATEFGRARATVEQLQARVMELEEENEILMGELAAARQRLRAAGLETEPEGPDSDADPGRDNVLVWTGDEDDGYLGHGLAEGKYPIAYTVAPVTLRGITRFEARVITDPDADFTLPVEQLADGYGEPLTRDVKGQRRTLDPLPTAEEAKECCEIAYARPKRSAPTR
jgi:hypothetical protein